MKGKDGIYFKLILFERSKKPFRRNRSNPAEQSPYKKYPNTYERITTGTTYGRNIQSPI